MGAGLLLGVAATAGAVAGRALAAAVLPVSALAVFLCISRGGTIVLVAGVVVFLLLAADRLPQLLTLGVAGLGGALLIAAADQRPAVKAGVDTTAARSDGGEVLVLCVLV